MVEIKDVYRKSRAFRAGIRAGDVLLSINGNPVADVLDYRFYLAEKKVTLDCLREKKPYQVTIKKDVYDDIGLSFETPLMDEKQRCKNACIFCFIDQLPKGLRESLYFKDDDSRLSFLHGNYITLTNMSDGDIDRIVKMRFSPMNISVHTTNPELRVKMMKNPRAGEVLSYMQRLKEAGIAMRAQIVLCRGINDGAELDRSMRDLSALFPALDSVSIVPVGLTEHREGLYPLEPFSAEECLAIIRQVNGFGDDHFEKTGSRLFFLADEFYLGAGLPIPEGDYYEDYAQIENGVGMLRSFTDEFLSALDLHAEFFEDRTRGKSEISIATGEASYPMMAGLAERLVQRAPWLGIRIYSIQNRFFGEHITVSGLLTGKDIGEQLKDKPLGKALLLPRVTLRAEGDLFLCGKSVEELEEELQVPLVFVENDGQAFLESIIDAASAE